jgi:antitoxin ParD1/3/4
MVVTLSPELEDLIREKVASGDYRDEGDVIRRALLLLDEQERFDALEAALDEGEADLREGRVTVVPRRRGACRAISQSVRDRVLAGGAEQIGSHIAFYRFDSVQVRVARILHQRMDFERRLGPPGR